MHSFKSTRSANKANKNKAAALPAPLPAPPTPPPPVSEGPSSAPTTPTPTHPAQWADNHSDVLPAATQPAHSAGPSSGSPTATPDGSTGNTYTRETTPTTGSNGVPLKRRRLADTTEQDLDDEGWHLSRVASLPAPAVPTNAMPRLLVSPAGPPAPTTPASTATSVQTAGLVDLFLNSVAHPQQAQASALENLSSLGPRAWTPTPPGGFPKVHFNDPLWRFRFIDPVAATKISAQAQTSLLITIWGVPAGSYRTEEAHTNLLQALSIILPASELPAVATPDADWGADNPRALLPINHVLYNISDASRQLLLDQGVYSLRKPAITFMVHQPGWEIPDFVTFLEGYTVFSDMPAMRASIIAALQNDAYLTTLIGQLAQANPDFAALTKEAAVSTILDSTSISVLPMKAAGNVDDWKLRVCMHSPTQEPLSWRTFRDAVRRINFPIQGNGFGTSWEVDIPCQ
ncbi:hypothetical protein BDW22DRAFT_1475566 [Trametopsis cervina]|nr:hypothetical protein BDW22DRAFT_1475566 [Trametopsis cervina]